MLPHHHHEEHFTATDLVKDIVIGMSDGLTVPFALAAGLSGAVGIVPHIILTAGIAEIAAGSIAMGLGGFLSGRTEVHHYEAELAREYEEVERIPEKEREEVREILEEMGLTAEEQHILVEALCRDKDKWVDFMMKFELGLEKPDANRATKSAFNIGGSYIVGGLIPLTPYALIADVPTALLASVGVTMLALFVFGYFKARLTGQNVWQGAVQTLLIGAAAAGTAYGLARLFSAQ